MKNRKRSAAVAAVTVAASVAMMFGASAPASAGTGLLHQVAAGTLNCPSYMVARVSFKTNGAGDVGWAHGSEVWFNFSTTTHYVYANSSGPNMYQISIQAVATISNVYGTCVV
jgi:hypothetical protein